jgi:hypothetical protein
MNNTRTDSSTAAVLTGAAIGALAGYLLWTEPGRQLLGTLLQSLEEFSVECRKLSQAIVRAEGVAVDSWRSFTSIPSQANARRRESGFQSAGK